MVLRAQILLFCLATLCWPRPPVPWQFNAWKRAPRTHAADGFHEPGVTAIFYEKPAYKGKPTRVFAWYGVPDHKPGSRVPGIVLVHGGGGTAFAEWVRLWNSRGYAAIAMDTCGSVPGPAPTGKPYESKPIRDGDSGGPPGWDASFDQIDDPITDQWTYHAVADIILANSLLRSLPGVDSSKIGVTGISWGGYLTAIVAGIDNRFRFAVPVYGCGFLGEDSYWVTRLEKMGPVKSAKWLSLWDPSVYLPNARMPMLWVDGTNDFAYPLSSLRKSYHLPHGKRLLAIRIRMLHSHAAGVAPEEISLFADEIVRGIKPPVILKSQGASLGRAWVRFHSAGGQVSAVFNFTKDSGPWNKRQWEETSLGDVTQKGSAEVMLPPGVTAYYLNLLDSKSRIVSSDLTIP